MSAVQMRPPHPEVPDDPTFITAVRDDNGTLIHYMAGHAGREIGTLRIKGEPPVLHVYIGTYVRQDGVAATGRQVVIATKLPEGGDQGETFEVVFVGPAAMAWELFHIHVQMLP